MYELNYFILISTGIINILPVILLYKNLNMGIKQLYFVFSAVSIFLYSGFGLSYKHIGSEFIAHYLIFSTMYIFIIFFVLKYDIKLKKSKNKVTDINLTNITSYKTRDGNELKYNWLFNIGALLYLLTFLIFLFIPNLRINHLWNPPASSLRGIYETISVHNSNPILNVAQTLRTFLLPFFMIKLYIFKTKNQSLKGLFLILVWLYLDYLSSLYIGRYEIAVSILFVFFYMISDNNINFKLKKKYLIFVGIGAISAIPFLASYQFSRLGMNITNVSFVEALSILSSETMIPKYYPVAAELSSSISPIRYYLWFLVLPIPFLPMKAEIGVLINRVFTSYILGVNYGNIGYSGLLPSLLGEAILIYNEYFFWIHAIFLGIVIGNLCKLLIKNKELSVLNLYFGVRLISIARGGSQGFLGVAINSIIIYLIVKYFIKGISRENNKYNSRI